MPDYVHDLLTAHGFDPAPATPFRHNSVQNRIGWKIGGPLLGAFFGGFGHDLYKGAKYYHQKARSDLNYLYNNFVPKPRLTSWMNANTPTRGNVNNQIRQILSGGASRVGRRNRRFLFKGSRFKGYRRRWYPRRNRYRRYRRYWWY